MRCDGNKALEILLGRLNDCLWDIHDNIPIDIVDEIRNLKIDLIDWAMLESHQNATHASRLLNLNRTTMVSMMQNELAPVIKRRKK